MAWEYGALKNKEEVLRECPNCLTEPFTAFLRGQVMSPWRKFWNRFFFVPYCCLICAECKEIVGYEHPGQYRLAAKQGEGEQT